NVGIGISNPTRAKFEVHGAAGEGSTSAIFGGESTGISLQRNWPSIGFNQYYNGPGDPRYIGNGFAAVQYLDPNYGGLFLDLYPNGLANDTAHFQKRALSIFQSGNLAIGAAHSNYSLYVSRNPGSIATAYLHGSTHHSAFNFGEKEHTYIRAGKDSGMVYLNDIPHGKVIMSGFVGINTETPAYTLEIRQKNGSGILLVSPGHFHHWGITTAGDGVGGLSLRFAGHPKGYFDPVTGAYSHFSDRRLKKNIKALPSLLEKILQLEPLEYEMINDNPSHRKTIGFIAQDVRRHFPELVTISRDTINSSDGLSELHSLDYDGFGILAIKAIQEQQVIITALEKKLELLEQQYKTIMQWVSIKK
ncbi:MAG TPA: tail fiber domain-containing protein, partial [Chitinophagaceae bacterium]|nr:tail fiber domain-containing protein [Chitinophagaceae bacterium]